MTLVLVTVGLLGVGVGVGEQLFDDGDIGPVAVP